VSRPAGNVHQFVATAEPGAVGTHTLHVQDLVRERMGLTSEIYAEHRRGVFAELARPLHEYQARAGDVLIYQMAIGSGVADFVVRQAQEREAQIVLNHHNLTPRRYLLSWDPGAAFGVEWGNRQLQEMAPHTELGIAVSHFNEQELLLAGYSRTVVAPVLFDPSQLASEPDDSAVSGRVGTRNGAAWLFVGRIAANKGQQYLIRALAVYRRLYDPEARLYLVGGPVTGQYADALRSYAAAIGVAEAVDFTGAVTQRQLASYYRNSDVFVCLSEHEGFCVPLVEAMTFGLPVVAGRTSAVPETVGSAGLLLTAPRGQPAAAAVAAGVHRVMNDSHLRDRLVAAGRARAEELSLARSKDRMLEALRQVVSTG
jgi:glycosyltransferase involved in cell wall biosynthesis